jgi:hypothetical protein
LEPPLPVVPGLPPTPVLAPPLPVVPGLPPTPVVPGLSPPAPELLSPPAPVEFDPPAPVFEPVVLVVLPRPASPPSRGPPSSTVSPQAADSRTRRIDCAVLKDVMVRSVAS